MAIVGKPQFLRDENGWPITRLHQSPERHYQVQTDLGPRVLSAGVTSVTKETENVEILKTWFLNKGMDVIWNSPLVVPEGTFEEEEQVNEETGEVTTVQVPLTKAKILRRARKAGPEALGAAGNFGSMVHGFIDDHLKSDDPLCPLDLDNLITWDEPRKDEILASLDLWEFWWSRQRLRRILAAEKPICSERYGYAGTPDLVFIDQEDRVVLCDWKTSKRIYGSYLLQAGAYAEAMMEFGIVVDVVQIVRMDVAKNRVEVFTMTHPDLARCRHMFLHSLAHWKNLQSLPEKLKQGTTYAKPTK